MLSEAAFQPVDKRETESGQQGLIARAKAGEREAMESLILLHERRVLATSLRLLGNLEDAKDAAQSVFLRLFRYIGGVREESELGPWLYRVTVNVCFDLEKKRRGLATIPLDDAQEPQAGGEDNEAMLAEKKVMEAALKELSPNERAAIVLRELQGLTTREVATILRSSETTIRSHISRARVKLKSYRDRALRRQK